MVSLGHNELIWLQYREYIDCLKQDFSTVYSRYNAVVYIVELDISWSHVGPHFLAHPFREFLQTWCRRARYFSRNRGNSLHPIRGRQFFAKSAHRESLCSCSQEWGGWGCEVSCGGHHRPKGKTTTGSALDGAVFDTAQILAYLVHNMSRSQLYLGFGHFGWLPSFFGQ